MSGEGRAQANPFANYEKLCDQGNDVVQDFIDTLWKYPLAFQRMVSYKHREAIIDIFAGRLYGEIGESNSARIAMRKLLASQNVANQPVDTQSISQACGAERRVVFGLISLARPGELSISLTHFPRTFGAALLAMLVKAGKVLFALESRRRTRPMP